MVVDCTVGRVELWTELLEEKNKEQAGPARQAEAEGPAHASIPDSVRSFFLLLQGNSVRSLSSAIGDPD
jgi:hypothetical protein